MEAIQLFLNISKEGLSNDWNAKLTEVLKALPSAEQVQIIEQNESSYAQISISYKLERLSFDAIEKVVVAANANITDINIHFPSGITGVGDPYGASAISISIDENLKNIEGVLGGAISSKGELKVALDTTAKNKQVVIDEILKTYFSIRSGKTTL